MPVNVPDEEVAWDDANSAPDSEISWDADHEGMTHFATGTQKAASNYYNQLLARGSGHKDLADSISEMPLYKQAGTALGNEVNLLRRGTNKLGYMLGGTIADAWHQAHPGLVSSKPATEMYKKELAEQDKIDEENKLFREFNENANPIANVVGRVPPYILNGRLFGKGLASVAEDVVSTLSDVPRLAAKEGKSAIVRGTEAAAQSSNPFIRALGIKFKNETNDNMVSAARAAKNKPNIINPYRQGMLGNIGGSTILGASESAIHPNQEAWEGALSSGAGSILGNMIKPAVTNMPNFRADNPTERSLLKWGEGEGLRWLPGMETGSKRLQKFEHAMRADSTFADPIHMIDSANDKVYTNIAARSMGMSPTDIANDVPLLNKQLLDKHKPYLSNIGKVESTSMSPEMLRQHDAYLSDLYNQLEAGTFAHFRPQDVRALNKYAKDIADDPSIDDKVKKTVLGYTGKIISNMPTRNPLTGQIITRGLEGDNYQSIRRNLRRDINAAYNGAFSDPAKAESLSGLLKHIDDAVERGVANGKGATAVAQWKDVNERNAMTHLVLQHATKPTGQFDPQKLYTYLMGPKEVERTLKGEGGRIRDLQNVAKLSYMSHHQMGSDLSGMGVRNIINSEKPGIVDKLLTSPMAGYVDAFAPIPSLALKLYTKGYPVKTGYLNLSGRGFGNFPLYTRALEQAAQPAPRIKKFIDDKFFNKDDK